MKTPGREDDDTETRLYTKADVRSRQEQTGSSQTGSTQGGPAQAGTESSISELITKGLGGKENINNVDCCATRLRITVKDSSLVDEDTLKSTGATGVIHKGQGIQVVYGPHVTVIKSDLEDYLDI